MLRFLLSRLRARIRSGAIFLSACVMLATAQQSWSLGLGEIELSSALNQEFNATIDLMDASGLEPGEIIVSLGSSEDFDRVGVERFFFLTDLSFEVTYGAAGNAAIKVTSSRPITEPYLNFLVEILWPSGRLLKEYTVLLDPPTFSPAAAPPVSAPVRPREAVSSSGRVERQVAPASSGTSGTRVDLEADRPSEPSPLDRGVEGREYGMTDRDDTLWTIASATRTAGTSVQQQMLAIQRLNPTAFINGNINLLKAGFVLRLPDEQQARTLGDGDAIAEVAQQNEEWRAARRGESVPQRETQTQVAAADETSELRSPVDATDDQEPAMAQTGPDGELRIVAEDGDSTTGIGAAPGSDLAAALEETDRLSRQVDELTYQLDREQEVASDELVVRERQLEVKDQQIAELQAQLAAAQEAQAAVPPQSQNQSTSAPPPSDAPWWESPYVLYGGAGVLVLVLAGGMFAARRRRDEEDTVYFDDEMEEEFEDQGRQEPALADAMAEDVFEDQDDDESFGEDTQYAQTSDEELEEELESSQTSDVIGEADIYIAYGRYPQAIGLLLAVLEEDAFRNDARLKLLEVYAETGDRGAFDEHMGALVENCEEEDALLAARELESRFGEAAISLDDMLSESEDEDELGGLGGADEEDATEIAVPEAVAEDDLTVEATAADETVQVDSAMDFELELDEISDQDEPANGDESADTVMVGAGDGSGDDLGGDLGIDFNPDRDVEASPEPVQEAEEVVADTATAIDADEDELKIDQALEDAALELDQADGFEAAPAPTAGAHAAGGAEESLDDLEFDTVATADEDFEFQDEGDSANTKLDLARAYIDMGDADGARDILKEVLDEGNSDQQQKAQTMLETL